MKRDYMIYGLAVLAGFVVYLVLDRLLGIDFAIAMIAGFVTIHGGIVLGRRYL
jgi:Na+/glutamate symporter